MTQKYTPDTDSIKLAYALSRDDRKYPSRDIAAWDAIKKEAFEAFDRWLAAHDAQIRADEHVKALELTDYEIEIMADAYSNSDEFNHGDDVGAMSVAVQAIIKHRREQKQ